jgi:hypothetical protein
LLALALFGLNMGGAIATAKNYLRNQPHLLKFEAGGGGKVDYYSDGSSRRYLRHPRTGKMLLISERPALSPPRFFQIWSPVIASGSASLLVLVFALWRAPRRTIAYLMCRVRAAYSDRALVTAVALVSLNLAGAIATSAYYPKERMHVGVESLGLTSVVRGADGFTSVYQEVSGGGYRLTEVVREPLPPSLLRIWSPVVASALITLLVLVVPSAHPDLRHNVATPYAGGGQPDRLHFLRPSARWLTIIAALIGLNIAGAVSRPPPDRSDIALAYDSLFGGVPSVIILKIDGRAVAQRLVDGSDLLRPTGPGDSEQARDDGSRIGEGTINYKTDGSIVAYSGSPGHVPSRSSVIWPPTRSLLETWSPLVISASTTLLVLAIRARDCGLVRRTCAG